MASATLEAKAFSAYCGSCGRFEFETRDIGHLHNPREVSCLGCQYLTKCPTCNNTIYVRELLKYIHLCELFTRRSAIIDGEIVTINLALG